MQGRSLVETNVCALEMVNHNTRMSLINVTDKHLSNNVSYTKLERQLLLFWQTYRTLPDWAIKHILIPPLVGGILTNTLLLIYFARSGKYRIPVFTTLASLSMCDWLTCWAILGSIIVLLPNVAFRTGSNPICKLLVYILPVSYHSSVCHLLFLSMLRYVQLCFPLWAKVQVIFSRVVKVCVVMWATCFLITSPYLVYIKVHWLPYGKDGTQLGIMHFAGNNDLKEVLLSVFCQVIPLILLALLHGLKIFKLSQNSKLRKEERRSSSSRTVTIIITLFVLSIVPRVGHTFYHSMLGYPYQPFHFLMFYYATFISYSNSILNPWVYLLASKEIRGNIIETFRGRKKMFV